MAFNQGEASTAGRELRQIAADIEHAATMLPWYADGKVGGAQILGTLNAAVLALRAQIAAITTDIGD